MNLKVQKLLISMYNVKQNVLINIVALDDKEFRSAVLGKEKENPWMCTSVS